MLRAEGKCLLHRGLLPAVNMELWSVELFSPLQQLPISHTVFIWVIHLSCSCFQPRWGKCPGALYNGLYNLFRDSLILYMYIL